MSLLVFCVQLLEKMKHYDADERSMATSDLINELKNAQLEATLQVTYQLTDTDTLTLASY
jgi:hypothetical protein